VKAAIGLLRPLDAAQRSAARLHSMGYLAAFAPVTQIVASGAQPPGGAFDAILATSARAFAFLSDEDRARFASTRLFAVGEATLAAARSSGLAGAGVDALEAHELEQLLIAQAPPGARLLYLAARDRKPRLERALAAAGIRVEIVEIYRAEARPAWSADEARAVCDCAAVLHYSHRSAGLGLELAARAGFGEGFRALPHICLSSDVAAPLVNAGARTVGVAGEPRERALFVALQAEMERKGKPTV